MKLTCTQEKLIRGLNVVSHIAGKNISLPILNNILFKTSNGVLTLISTNLDIGIKTTVRGKIEKEGEITVQAKLLVDYISLLPSGNIELEKKENDLIIKAGGQKSIIKGQAAEDYPIVPEVNNIEELEIESSVLKESLSEVIFSASYDEIRPELSGILFLIKDNEFILAATDSYRLAEKRIEIIDNKLKNLNKIVPIRVLQEVIRILGDSKEKIKIGFSHNQVVFSIEDVVIISRLIEGNYPDYKEIIPKEYKTKALINKIDFIKAIKTASLFSKIGINDVFLEFDKNKKNINISATNIQLGENNSTINIEVEGENNNVVFNYKYLLDGLQNIKGKKIVLEITSSDTPVLLKSENENNYLYLIMPIRK